MKQSILTSLFLGLRSTIRGNRGITIMTILMMAIIFINLLFLPSLINGAVVKINEQITGTATGDLIINPAKGTDLISSVNQLKNDIEGINGVAATAESLVIGSAVSYGNMSVATSVEAIVPDNFSKVFYTPENVISGSFFDEDTAGQIFLGVGVAGANMPDLRTYSTSLQTVEAGDTVNLVSAQPGESEYDVVGVFFNEFPLSDLRAYVSYNEVVKANPVLADKANTIYIKLDEGADVSAIEASILGLRNDIQLRSSEELSAPVQDQIETFDLINNILKIISLIVAAITVFIITYVDLVNKRRHIGIERAIGIKSHVIVASYVLKATAYSVVGVVLGYSIFLAIIVPYVEYNPFGFPNGDVVLSVSAIEVRQNILILIVVTIIAAALPAWRSVRLKILDAIWGK